MFVKACCQFTCFVLCVCCRLQARRGGGGSLPADLSSRRDPGCAGRSQRFGLRLPPSAPQCSGQTAAYSHCVAAAGPQPPGRHTHTAEPTHRGEESTAAVAVKSVTGGFQFCRRNDPPQSRNLKTSGPPDAQEQRFNLWNV